MEQLNQELIVEILLWLPVKSLHRFRCLSKSLCALIDSSNFSNWHLTRSWQNFNQRKLIFSDGSSNEFHVCDVNVDLEDEIIRLGKPVSSLWKEVLGYCNGLVLLNGSESQVKFGFEVWNPSTRQYREVPGYPFKVTSKVQIIGSGLGYDDSTDDYKVFLMVSSDVGKFPLGAQVWIYGLKSKSWRKAQNFPCLEYITVSDEDRTDSDQGFPGIGYFTDGSLHWLCTLFSGGWNTKIMAFDVRKERFSSVPQPVCSINSVKGVSRKLHVLEGCLCVSYFCSSWNTDGVNQADLYTRKKDGVDQFTWTKLYSVTEPLFFDICWFEMLKVLGYSKGGDKIMLDLNLDYMVSYDLDEKSFKKLEIEMAPNWDNPSLCFVVESLVPGGDGA